MSLYSRVLEVGVANNELNLVYSTIGLALSKNGLGRVRKLFRFAPNENENADGSIDDLSYAD